MTNSTSMTSGNAVRGRYAKSALVFQGGGALGAYQAGVYEALSEAGCEPDWLSGISIGAINAAIIAGNEPGMRLPRLRKFWEQSTSIFPWSSLEVGDEMKRLFNYMSAGSAMLFGQPGFFAPQLVPAILQPHGTPGAVSYDQPPRAEPVARLV